MNSLNKGMVVKASCGCIIKIIAIAEDERILERVKSIVLLPDPDCEAKLGTIVGEPFDFIFDTEFNGLAVSLERFK